MFIDYTPRQVAIHEAGHFVFCCAQNLPIPEVLSIEPQVIGATMEHQINRFPEDQTALGFCARKLDVIEQLLNAEIEGRALEEVAMNIYGPTMVSLMTPATVADFLKRYRMVRDETAVKLILMHVAGTAADAELCGGKGIIPFDDLKSAHDLAKLLAGEEGAGKLVSEKYSESCGLCRGTYRQPIHAAADKLQAAKTLRESDLSALWLDIQASFLTTASTR